MEGIVGLLKVKVVKGTRLAVRDLVSSDPYVVLRLGGQLLPDPRMLCTGGPGACILCNACTLGLQCSSLVVLLTVAAAIAGSLASHCSLCFGFEFNEGLLVNMEKALCLSSRDLTTIVRAERSRQSISWKNYVKVNVAGFDGLWSLLAQFKSWTVKTRVIKSNLNPVWDDELTVSVHNFNVPLKLQVFDKDTFSADDKMGDAEIDLQPLATAVGMKTSMKSIPDGSQLCRLMASNNNCLAKDSCIQCVNGNIVQEMCVRLQHVESGEVELQLKWIDITN